MFSDNKVVKGVLAIVANTFKMRKRQRYNHWSFRHPSECTQCSIARRVSSVFKNLNEQLKWDMSTCKWFSVQCDKSVDNSNTVQLIVFIRMMFNDFSVRGAAGINDPEDNNKGCWHPQFDEEEKVPLEKTESSQWSAVTLVSLHASNVILNFHLFCIIIVSLKSR